MRYIFLLFYIQSIVGITTIAQTETNYKLDSIIVTANRVPTIFSEVGRSFNVITSQEIAQLPVNNLHDLLEYSSGLDIKQRGPQGVQADVSIRGGSFEQTLILIDGIKLSDPQTGHHNMNLPISFSQIERIEILKGQGSRSYGANAFSGVINIIPKQNAINNLQLNLSGGENNYFNLGINGSLKSGNTNHHMSFEKSKSNGYRTNTEFDNHIFSINNSFNFSSTVVKTILGYTKKDFGANSYYTTRFPNQAEKTETYLAALSAEIELDDLNIMPKIYWRKNNDEFVLNKFDHSFYKNNHETNVYGGEIQISTNILGELTSFGVEYSQDQIASNNLGEHKRQTNGFFIEQKISASKNLNFSLGGFAYYYPQINWKFWPGIDAAYNFSENLKIFANYGRAFRIPTYTELYYSDPITLGNFNLIPEESDNYELGLNYNYRIVNFKTSYFIKDGKNLIDYVLDNSDDIWKARNFTKINTNGFELGLMFNLRNVSNDIIQRLAFDYTYLNSDKAELGLNSRYVLEHLKHDLSIELFHSLPFGIKQSWTINYEDRVTLGEHFTIDTKLNRNFSLFNIFITATNLLNKSYEEIPGVPLPGRWIIGGVKLNIL
jgi:vitamin B12 transporter